MINQRVLGVLAVSRALGDHELKNLVTCKPHMITTGLPSARLPAASSPPFSTSAETRPHPSLADCLSPLTSTHSQCKLGFVRAVNTPKHLHH